MNVYVVLYRYNTAEQEDSDVIGVYADHDKASYEAARHMNEVRDRLEEHYDDNDFDADFEVLCEDYISFGFYGTGYGSDHVWVCSVECLPLE